MKGIQESVAIANQFYFFAGFVIILFGGIFIFIYSKKITRPIIEMSNVAEDISNMNFTKIVKIDTQDEIERLGRSINLISNKLSTSINALREDVNRRKLLVRNISHELKTPIGVIKGYAEGLKFGVANDPGKMDKYCTVIAEECDRMDGMIRELLNLSLLESGTFSLNIKSFDLCELVENVADRFSHIISEKDIKLELKFDAKIVTYADPELIERALTNLLTNAINHVEDRKIIQIKVQKHSDKPRISVFNTGNHISESDIERIWDVFYKADKARSRQYGGHGLGLSIVKLIAQAHGGSYGVENVTNGVCFYFDFTGKDS
jgi:signal transduction histidine kinase